LWRKKSGGFESFIFFGIGLYGPDRKNDERAEDSAYEKSEEVTIPACALNQSAQGTSRYGSA
jgi:hypothetical protein